MSLIPASAALAQTGGPPDPGISEYKTHDDLLLEIAQLVPEFGGKYVSEDGATLHVHVLAGQEDVLDAEEVKQAIESVHPSFTDGREVSLIPAQFTMTQLHGWYTLMQDSVWAIPEVTMTDLQEAENRIDIGIDDLAAKERIEAKLTALGIPLEAIAIHRAGRVRFNNHKLDEAIPGGKLEGGYQIGGRIITSRFTGTHLCTLGFPVERVDPATSATTKGFITVGHCTQDTITKPWDGGVQSTGFYQPSHSATHIGTEVTDPEVSSSLTGCPSGMKCRRTDSAFIELEPGIDFSLGKIAKPTGGGTTVSHTHSFRIVSDTSVAAVGDTVHKVGKETGQTGGRVHRTCYKHEYWFDITVLCLDGASYAKKGGDSGGPVFRITNSPNTNDVQLVGIHTGEQRIVDDLGGTTTFAVYSPVGSIYLDLGKSYTWNACVSGVKGINC